MRALTIKILETGSLPQELQEKYGDYAAMFRNLLTGKNPHLSFESYAILEDKLPEKVASCDAWLITGSKHAVYERHAWIEGISEFIRQAYAADIPLIGICFGHQLIVQALGWRVQKSANGWGLGATRYPLSQRPTWMQTSSGVDAFTIQAFHQDQVITPPEHSEIIVGSEFCPYAALNIDNKALTFQGHPEFSATFNKTLFTNRRPLKTNNPPSLS
ncbi:MAG: hypothetical protein HRU05_05690 [Oceanospirillaceae bacterium]|nr:hypothetical protein [Oceanospirillaceae bacterium]